MGSSDTSNSNFKEEIKYTFNSSDINTSFEQESGSSSNKSPYVSMEEQNELKKKNQIIKKNPNIQKESVEKQDMIESEEDDSANKSSLTNSDEDSAKSISEKEIKLTNTLKEEDSNTKEEEKRVEVEEENNEDSDSSNSESLTILQNALTILEKINQMKEDLQEIIKEKKLESQKRKVRKSNKKLKKKIKQQKNQDENKRGRKENRSSHPSGPHKVQKMKKKEESIRVKRKSLIENDNKKSKRKRKRKEDFEEEKKGGNTRITQHKEDKPGKYFQKSKKINTIKKKEFKFIVFKTTLSTDFENLLTKQLKYYLFIKYAEKFKNDKNTEDFVYSPEKVMVSEYEGEYSNILLSFKI